MDQQTIDKLMELKKLYEAGILTQEEVEVEKKKILNPHQAQPVNEPAPESEQPTEPEEEDVAIEEDAMPIMQDNEGRFIFEQPKVEQPSEPTNEPTSTDKKPNVWMWVAIVLGVVLLIFMLAKSKDSGSNDYDNQQYSTVEAVDSVSPEYADEPAEIEAPPIEINPDQFIQEGSEEDFEINCPWRKEYFHNDFGEDMYEHPYIATTIGGSWNLEIVYSKEIGFRFALRENDGEYKHMYAPVSIIFRDSNGKTYQFEPDGVENYCAFVQSKSNAQGIARLLEEGNFDVLMKYNMYNEPHSMTWKSYMRPNMFKKSIDKFLN